METEAFKRAFKRACKDGMAPYRYGRIMVTGKYGDGKTSLIQALFGKPIPEDHVPTEGLDAKHTCKVDITKCTEDWSELLSEKKNILDNHLAMDVVRELKEEQIQEFEQDTQEKISEDELPLFGKVAKGTKEKDEDKAVIFIWDFGGQEAYTNLHPIFLRTECVHIVVYDLEKLENAQDKQEWKSYSDQIEFWLQMIQSNCNSPRSTEQQRNVILVGTHKDKLQGKNAKDREMCAIKLEQNLQKKLSGKHYKFMITEYFHVDSKGGIKEDSENFKQLKQCLIESIKECPTWEESRPIPYMRLLGKLYDQEGKREHAMMKFKDIMGLAGEYNITSDEDVQAFLQFHHATGDLTFFPTLPDYVIVDPQWLINVFTAIITIDYHYKQKKDTDPVELERLRNEALIKKGGMLFEGVWKPFLNQCNIEMIEYLKELMQRFDLMVSLDDFDYLVPCLLQPKEGHLIPAAIAPPDTIYLKFHATEKSQEDYKKGKNTYDNFLPPALLLQLICRLENKWAKDSGELQPEKYRNLFSFILRNQVITIAMAINSTWISISLEHVEKEKASAFLNEVTTQINALLGKYYSNMWYEYCINPCHGKQDETEQCTTRTGVSSITSRESAKRATCQNHATSSMEIEAYDFWFGKLCIMQLL